MSKARKPREDIQIPLTEAELVKLKRSIDNLLEGRERWITFQLSNPDGPERFAQLFELSFTKGETRKPPWMLEVL